MIMKKLLSAIAWAGILGMAILASAPAQAQIGGNTESAGDDLTSVFNDDSYEVSDELEQLVTELPLILEDIDSAGLLSDPDQLDELYNAYASDSDSGYNDSGYNADGWVISKGGCSVDVDCVVSKIGVVTAWQCYTSAGLEPEAVAKCLQEKDQQKYLAAASCTYGNCPSFTGLPGQLFAASTCQNAKHPSLAGHLLLNAPANFEENTAQPLPVDLLFKG
jgi:hypothetical protein